ERKKFSESIEVTYENSDIDENLKKILDDDKYQLSWISYDKFENIHHIGKGAFATVYKAQWHDKHRKAHDEVALKLIHNSNVRSHEFIIEIAKPFYSDEISQIYLAQMLS
ncbi:hypothetical protein C2G38_2053858, partial [Gigaspora rosea]